MSSQTKLGVKYHCYQEDKRLWFHYLLSMLFINTNPMLYISWMRLTPPWTSKTDPWLETLSNNEPKIVSLLLSL